MNLKNKHLEALFEVLNYNMPFKKARVRDSFLLEIGKHFQMLENNKQKIYEALAIKDKQGKLKTETIGDKTRYIFTDKNAEKMEKEYDILINEEIKVDQENKNKKEILEMIENSTAQLKTGIATQIEDFLSLNKQPCPLKPKHSSDK